MPHGRANFIGFESIFDNVQFFSTSCRTNAYCHPGEVGFNCLMEAHMCVPMCKYASERASKHLAKNSHTVNHVYVDHISELIILHIWCFFAPASNIYLVMPMLNLCKK